ncbi:MAG: hypothetical protein II815_10450 [Bacteroidales bacterium]|nr:hypothetical protein [Bacteroidales bacterium]
MLPDGKVQLSGSMTRPVMPFTVALPTNEDALGRLPSKYSHSSIESVHQ